MSPCFPKHEIMIEGEITSIDVLNASNAEQFQFHTSEGRQSYMCNGSHDMGIHIWALFFIIMVSQCGKLNFWSNSLKTDDSYTFYTKFPSSRTTFCSSSCKLTHIGKAGVSFPHCLSFWCIYYWGKLIAPLLQGLLNECAPPYRDHVTL